MKHKKIVLCCIAIFLWFGPRSILAAPYFSVTGPTSIHIPNTYDYAIYLHPDGKAINTAQTILVFDRNYLSGSRISTLNSRCSFFAPADPLLGYGSTGSPYFLNDEKAVIACGFTNTGIPINTTQAQLIATVTLAPITLSNTQTTLNFSNTVFKYIGQSVTSGTDQSLTLSVYISTASANPTATPYPSPTPVNPRTITSDDLNFVDISTGSSRPSTSSAVLTPQAITPVQNVILDDTIPTPGPLTQRPTFIPMRPTTASASAAGDILSLRSLRELLLPGKTTADKTVVFINLITTLAFLVILTFLLWRMFLLSRTNKLKISYMQQIIEGEIAMLLGKTKSSDPKTKMQVDARLEDIRSELGNKPENIK